MEVTDLMGLSRLQKLDQICAISTLKVMRKRTKAPLIIGRSTKISPDLK
jgi:hypothetical protein